MSQRSSRPVLKIFRKSKAEELEVLLVSKNWKGFKGIIRKTLNHSILLPNGEQTRANKLLGAASKLSKDDREQASTQGK
jgi:hypothetical protein